MKKYCLFVFPDSAVFDKVSAEIRITADMQKFTDMSHCHKNVPNIVSLSHCKEHFDQLCKGMS